MFSSGAQGSLPSSRAIGRISSFLYLPRGALCLQATSGPSHNSDLIDIFFSCIFLTSILLIFQVVNRNTFVIFNKKFNSLLLFPCPKHFAVMIASPGRNQKLRGKLRAISSFLKRECCSEVSVKPDMVKVLTVTSLLAGVLGRSALSLHEADLSTWA